MRGTLLAAMLLIAPERARAFDICKYLKDGGVAGCNDVKVGSGGSLPSQAAAQRMNPSSIPTSATPWGVEAITSLPPDSDSRTKHAFALVKGFKQFGTGVSSDSDDTFFTHSYLLAARETSRETDYERIYVANDKFVRSLSVGTSFAFPVGKSLAKVAQPSLGVLARYNVPMHQWGWGTGLNLSSRYFSLGASYLTQPNEYEQRQVPMWVGMAGVGYGKFRLDYASMNYLNGVLKGKPASLLTLSLSWRRFIVFGGKRWSTNLDGESLDDYLVGAQFLLGRHLALGTMANYIPGRFSVGAQVFL